MERLFPYGALQTGGPNEHVLSTIYGEWEPASVTGNLVERGWGAATGYPDLALDETGREIQGQVFSSPQLNRLWNSLDEFEGDEHEGVITSATLNNGARIKVQVCVLRPA